MTTTPLTTPLTAALLATATAEQAVPASDVFTPHADYIAEFIQFLRMQAQPQLKQLQASIGWQDKYRIIMQLGKQLPAMPLVLQQQQYLVPGCDSKAWLCQLPNQSIWLFDSEARVVKGLVLLLLCQLLDQSSANLKRLNLLENWQQLGLAQQLSPSRNNGLLAVIQRIQSQIATLPESDTVD